MLSVTTPLMSKARQPASQPTPQRPAASPAPSSHSVLRIEPSDATTTSASTVLPSESWARRTWPPASPTRDVTPTPVRRSTPWSLHRRGNGADHAAERADERRRAALDDGHREAQLAADRGHFRADKTGADDQDPRRPGRQRLLQTGRIIARADREHPVQRGLCRMKPRSCADPGGDQQAVVRHLLAMGQAHHLGSAIQAGRGHAEPPLRVDGALVRQRGVVGRYPALQHLLGERGAIVRLVRLVADDRQVPPEALCSQGLGRTEARQGGADDDDPTAGLELLDQGVHRCDELFTGPHDAPPASPSSPWSTRIACTGQAAAARITRRRSASSGFGSYLSASSPLSLKTSGARKTHWAYPWQRFRSTTRRRGLLLRTIVVLPVGSMVPSFRSRRVPQASSRVRLPFSSAPACMSPALTPAPWSFPPKGYSCHCRPSRGCPSRAPLRPFSTTAGGACPARG